VGARCTAFTVNIQAQRRHLVVTHGDLLSDRYFPHRVKNPTVAIGYTRCISVIFCTRQSEVSCFTTDGGRTLY